MLERLAENPPEYLVFCFSGHGDPEGIVLADGHYHFAGLADWIAAIGAPHSFTILDSCQAAAYRRYVGVEVGGLVGVLDEPWIEKLASATRGARLIFSTGARRTATESDAVRHGHFTWAWLRALLIAPGAIGSGRHRWVSDAAAFARARAAMLLKFGSGQVPHAIGLTGDFPLVRSQAHRAVGDATIDEAHLVSQGGTRRRIGRRVLDGVA